MIFLQILAVAFILGYIFGRKGNNSPPASNIQQPDYTYYYRLRGRIEAELTKTKAKGVRDTLTRILQEEAQADAQQQTAETAHASTWQMPDEEATAPQPAQAASVNAAHTTQPSTSQSVHEQLQQRTTDVARKNYIDNTSLLLYFGAFLFITSVGLFVAFADVEGGLKTVMVGIVALSLYGFGFWLRSSKKKLRQVGEAFIGIGMTAVPFIGITAYNYSSDDVNGAAIWAATSVLAFILYTATIIRLRSSFVSYMLVASIVSLIMSFAGIIDGPLYYFIWSLAVTGIALQLISVVVKDIQSFTEASHLSGQLLVPLSIGASLLAIGESGVAQVAMTTGLATLYYALLALSEDENRSVYSLAAHSLGLVTVGFGVYAINSDTTDVAIALLSMSGLHILTMLGAKSLLAEDAHLGITIATPIVATLLLIGEPRLFTLSLGAVWIVATTMTLRYHRLSALHVALVAWIALSYASGQLLPSDGISALQQSLLAIGFILPLVGLIAGKTSPLNEEWKESVRGALAGGLIIALLVAGAAGAYPLLYISLSMYLLCGLIHQLDSSRLWGDLELMFAGAPVLYAIFTQTPTDNSPYFSIATTLFLVVSIATALRHRLEHARWLSTASWLLLPIALMADKVGLFEPNVNDTIQLYILAIIALSLSRAIARGKLFLSTKIPIASMARSSSYSYFAGMLTATGVVTVFSFASASDALAIGSLVGITGFLLLHFWYIERSNYFFTLLPITFQLILLRILTPYNNDITDVNVLYPLISSLGAGMFVGYSITNQEAYDKSKALQTIDFLKLSVATLYIAPLAFFFTGDVTWPLPITAIIATLATLLYNKDKEEGTREWLGGLVLLSIFWLLGYNGINDIQIYAHITAALFGLYAYIRHQRGEIGTSNQYLLFMLGTATIPLAIESLSGSGRGNILGLWLLIEQIGFLLLGIGISKPIVTKWGLYVGVAAVLYQLRDLGWAMVAVLSVFIIGVAIFRALRQPDDHDN